MKSLYVENLSPALIEEVAEIHIESLPNDFLPGLGRDFLINNFYPAVINSEYGKAFAATLDGHACGFIIVTKDSSRFFRSIVKNEFWGFIKIGLQTSLSSITQLRNNLNIIYTALREDVKSGYGEIYEIAVSPTFQGRGVGAKLVARSIDYLETENKHGIKIKTLKENRDWIRSLEKNDWRIISEFKLIGKEYVFLCKEIG